MIPHVLLNTVHVHVHMHPWGHNACYRQPFGHMGHAAGTCSRLATW